MGEKQPPPPKSGPPKSFPARSRNAGGAAKFMASPPACSKSTFIHRDRSRVLVDSLSVHRDVLDLTGTGRRSKSNGNNTEHPMQAQLQQSGDKWTGRVKGQMNVPLKVQAPEHRIVYVCRQP